MLKEKFDRVARLLEENEVKITEELLAVQGEPVDLGGYFIPDPLLAEKVMRPSNTLNQIIDVM